MVRTCRCRLSSDIMTWVGCKWKSMLGFIGFRHCFASDSLQRLFPKIFSVYHLLALFLSAWSILITTETRSGRAKNLADWSAIRCHDLKSFAFSRWTASLRRRSPTSRDRQTESPRVGEALPQKDRLFPEKTVYPRQVQHLARDALLRELPYQKCKFFFRIVLQHTLASDPIPVSVSNHILLCRSNRAVRMWSDSCLFLLESRGLSKSRVS